MRSRFTGLCLGIMTILIASQGHALAVGPAPAPAPEIDGASISAGLGVLTAGILILRSRRRTK